ncbi:hypothetical protein NP493_21g04010 [Ridgeia piscesae]|uniref:Reverse transcriptase domain-containing protein n=1 Tax=Ridgeia piscesae TaxID=27915 RepID=A0AAD9PDI4_RIDPI|nr:hypothetical protein NP493_21g04010 [Ridgeia piscesae]
MLKILLNQLKPQAEKIIAEEQAGFRPGRSTTEQIFNLGILCEKYLQHQQDLYHVFIDFKKAFDRNHRRSKTRLSPTFFNIFLEIIMTDALNDHEGTVSIDGRNITNLRFAGDIDGLAGREEELSDLVERLDKTSTAFGM